MFNGTRQDSLCKRFLAASHSEQGLIIGGIVGPVYAAIRGLYTFENIPLVGGTNSFSLGARFGLGLFVGRYYGDGIGNRLGECIDVWKTNEPLNNRLYLMRVMPMLMGVLGLLLLSLWGREGGKPIFDPVDSISPFEMYLFTFLYSAYIGASLAMREGRALDLMTNNKLIADCGVIRFFTQYRQTAIDFHPVGDEVISEGSEMREPLSPAYHTVHVLSQELPRRRSSHDIASSSAPA